MGGRNLCRCTLNAKALKALPVGASVTDADMDIWTKSEGNLWTPERSGSPISTGTLCQYGPIKTWPYARKAQVTS